MLCTQKRLTQRRPTVESATSPSPRLPQDCTTGDRGPVVRLCAQRLVHGRGAHTATDTPTPRPTSRSNRSAREHPISSSGRTNSNRDSTGDTTAADDLIIRRTPLIVLTLSMAPETITMVPQTIRRDPRKLPSYCVRQRRHFGAESLDGCANDPNASKPSCCHRSSNANDSLRFCIRGREIGNVNRAEAAASACPISGRSTSVDEWGRRRHNEDEAERMDCARIDALLMLNLDGYEMDRFGHLPGDSRTPTPSVGRCRPLGSEDAEFPRAIPKRPPSPNTEKVIRIVFNDRS